MIKRICIGFLARLVRRAFNQIEKEFGVAFFQNQAVGQKLLMQSYRSLVSQGRERLPDFADVGFRAYSQFEEDGILLYIFSLIRPRNRKCVEICAGNGRENMTANLIINHGWWGYLFDGNPHSVEAGKRFFHNNKDTFLFPPRFMHAWINAENVNQLLAESGVSGSVDLLSLDMDGVDYWVWKAITVIDPLVVVCETHNAIPPEMALTVPYDAEFVGESEEFRSVSLAAMCKLGKEKGYRLIGTHRFGFNAFFMKCGVGEEYFPEVSPSVCVTDPYSTDLRQRLWPKMKGRNWHAIQ